MPGSRCRRGVRDHAGRPAQGGSGPGTARRYRCRGCSVAGAAAAGCSGRPGSTRRQVLPEAPGAAAGGRGPADLRVPVGPVRRSWGARTAEEGRAFPQTPLRTSLAGGPSPSRHPHRGRPPGSEPPAGRYSRWVLLDTTPLLLRPTAAVEDALRRWLTGWRGRAARTAGRDRRGGDSRPSAEAPVRPEPAVFAVRELAERRRRAAPRGRMFRVEGRSKALRSSGTWPAAAGDRRARPVEAEAASPTTSPSGLTLRARGPRAALGPVVRR